MPRLHVTGCIAASLFCFSVAFAADSKPNLTGTWKMNQARSDTGSTEIKSRVDTIEHQEPQVKITTTQDDENGKNTVVREYVTDGRQMTHTILGGERKSSARWDGNVLVIENQGDQRRPHHPRPLGASRRSSQHPHRPRILK